MTESTLITRMNAVSAGDMVLAGLFNDALQADKSLRRTGSDGIAIMVKDSVVTLTGHVRSNTHKTQADSVAHHMPGIVRFENQLVVDDKLALAVADALGNDARMGGEHMGVNAQRGFIYLTGSASNSAIRLLAAQIGAGVPQVRGIINRIQVPGVVNGDAEEQIFQPAIGQEIYTVNDELGTVLQVIIHPHSRRVSAVVVSATVGHQPSANATHHPIANTQFARQVVIPTNELRCAPSGALFLNPRDNKAARFDDFHARHYVTPPVGWQPPFPYHAKDVLFCRS